MCSFFFSSLGGDIVSLDAAKASGWEMHFIGKLKMDLPNKNNMGMETNVVRGF